MGMWRVCLGLSEVDKRHIRGLTYLSLGGGVIHCSKPFPEPKGLVVGDFLTIAAF